MNKQVVGGVPEFEIVKLERMLGTRLPPRYRAFLLEDGAGTLGRWEIYGLGTNFFGPPNLLWLLDSLQRRGQVPPRGVLPIADLGNGEYVSILLEPSDALAPGALVYWTPRVLGPSSITPTRPGFDIFALPLDPPR